MDNQFKKPVGGIKELVTKSKHGVKLWKQEDWEHVPNEKQKAR